VDNFLGTIVFLLPGLLLYFWLQSFGINPVVKHNPTEFTAVTILLWFPVSLTSLLIFNGSLVIANRIQNLKPIWSITDFKTASDNLMFLMVFLITSLIISFIYGLIWAKWLNPILLKVINKVRTWRGVAALSNTPSVWDEVFLTNEIQVVEVGKIDKPDKTVIGCLKKVSRPFEPERHVYLEDVKYFTGLIEKYRDDIPVTNSFYDVKSGNYVNIFNFEIVDQKMKEYDQFLESNK
jgi:hypothetical protein